MFRFYTIEQIKIVNRIVALQNLLLTLDQIKTLLKEDISSGEIRGMLRLKQIETEKPSSDQQQRFEIVYARLHQMEQEDLWDTSPVDLKEIPPQKVVSIREIKSTLDDVEALLKETERHVKPKGKNSLLAIYHDDGFYKENMDVQVGFPLQSKHAVRIPLSPGRELTLDELPGVDLMACMVHHGSWLTLPQGYGKLAAWIERNAYQIAGVGREVFHHIDWSNGGRSTVRELQLPVTRA